MPTFNSPAVKTGIVNYSGYINSSSTTVLGMVGGASMGPVNTPTPVTDEGSYVRTFGKPALTNYGQAAAIQYLQQGNNLYYIRVTDGTDVVAQVQVPSSTSTPTESFTVQGAYSGSGYNGYQVVVSNVNTLVTPNTFTATVLSPSGRSVAIFNNATMTGSSANYLPTLVSNASLDIVIVDPNAGAGSTPVAGTYTLSGGTNGDLNITDSDVVGTGTLGISAFSNADLYPINLLVTPGFNSNTVVTAGINLATQRGDMLYIVDTPQGLTVQEVIDWSNGAGTYSGTMTQLNSEYAAVYWPWVQSYDAYNQTNRWTPPSGWVAGVYAYNDSVGYPWTAPAGVTRGKLTQPIGIEYSASHADRDQLQGNGNVINPIVNFTNIGLVVWGQQTTLRQTGDLSRVNVVRLLAMIRRSIQASSMFLTFEANTQRLWTEWKNLVIPYLQQIQNEGGFYGFNVVMDSSIVTNQDIQQHYLPGQVSIQPTLDAEYIDIGFVLLPTGATFA